jgi:hypothetical protein
MDWRAGHYATNRWKEDKKRRLRRCPLMVALEESPTASAVSNLAGGKVGGSSRSRHAAHGKAANKQHAIRHLQACAHTTRG